MTIFMVENLDSSFKKSLNLSTIDKHLQFLKWLRNVTKTQSSWIIWSKITSDILIIELASLVACPFTQSCCHILTPL